ncbi:hypothetical protein BN1723_000986 [Verticillium longisporum]|uniref:Uncharacterized protein n=1 Tax=Verticillium longisporum TaxID=100787 RepID=A0A0G4NDF4_VERLO|nr:hypothetical protein BN1723_000986 [Verticillium longisporum]
MAPQKRTRDDTEDGSSSAPQKKHRKGFKVGPDNLPDGPWKRQHEGAIAEEEEVRVGIEQSSAGVTAEAVEMPSVAS